jgi:perosamine synthetase
MSNIEWWSPQLGKKEKKNLSRVINSNFPNEGRITLELEDYFSNYFGVKHAILTTSGTAAIYLGLKANGIGVGDRVAVPNLTFIATANAVKLTGATPVFVDVMERTLCIDHDQVLKKHAENPLSAVVPVHVSGRSALNLQAISIYRKLGIKIVEDAAEALGSREPSSGKHLGTLSNSGAFSFSPNKIITSGQGGLVITNDDDVALKIREIKDQGRPIRGTGGDDTHNSIGFNFKFTDLQAAVLQAQLTRVDHRIAHLKHIYSFYKSYLNPNLQVNLLNFDVANGELPLWPEYMSKNRNKLEKIFQKNKIDYRKIWKPITSQVPYFEDSEYPNSLSASTNILWLPSSFNLKPRDLKKITEVINSISISEKK